MTTQAFTPPCLTPPPPHTGGLLLERWVLRYSPPASGSSSGSSSQGSSTRSTHMGGQPGSAGSRTYIDEASVYKRMVSMNVHQHVCWHGAAILLNWLHRTCFITKSGSLLVRVSTLLHFHPSDTWMQVHMQAGVHAFPDIAGDSYPGAVQLCACTACVPHAPHKQGGRCRPGHELTPWFLNGIAWVHHMPETIMCCPHKKHWSYSSSYAIPYDSVDSP